MAQRMSHVSGALVGVVVGMAQVATMDSLLVVAIAVPVGMGGEGVEMYF